MSVEFIPGLVKLGQAWPHFGRCRASLGAGREIHFELLPGVTALTSEKVFTFAAIYWANP